jgi:signal-transduction protein with cAMP-binding, CBS, and nucleotidyltransferase domain
MEGSMKLVGEVIAEKGGWVCTADCQLAVGNALKLMAHANIGALVVLNAGYLAGIFSERDYARKAISVPNFSLATPVSELMTRRVYYVSPADTLDDCMALMNNRKVRHLPVLDEGILISLISVGDIVKQSLDEMDSRIKDLEEYLWIHMI